MFFVDRCSECEFSTVCRESLSEHKELHAVTSVLDPDELSDLPPDDGMWVKSSSQLISRIIQATNSSQIILVINKDLI